MSFSETRMVFYGSPLNPMSLTCGLITVEATPGIGPGKEPGKEPVCLTAFIHCWVIFDSQYFPLLSYKCCVAVCWVMHIVILLTRFCKLLTTVAIRPGGHVPQLPQWHDAYDYELKAAYITWVMLGTINGFSASVVTTHGDMEVPKFLPRKGPRGTYSQRWMSRATAHTMATTNCWNYSAGID